MRPAPIQAVVVSRNFHPGHYSFLAANYRLFTENGVDACMLHHPLFNGMSVVAPEKVANSFSELRKFRKLDLAVYWFPSLKNLGDMIRFRLFHGTKIAYVLHEPVESIRSYRQAGFSRARTAVIMLKQLVNYATVLLSHRVILPSEKATATFERNYRHLRKPHLLLPLLFDDEAGQLNGKADRHFISYIGTIAEDHAFDEFIRFALLAMEGRWFPGLKFLIATRSQLAPDFQEALEPHIQAGSAVVQQGSPMDNDTINRFYNGSIVIWNAYRRSMQSGVLPKAFMFGTPLVVADGNANEFYENGRHGESVSKTYDVDEIRKAVQAIVSRFEAYSSCCRSTFLSTFYYRSQDASLLRFLLD
jgi:glycosyltransferase involved in cell wall biosynthesis